MNHHPWGAIIRAPHWVTMSLDLHTADSWPLHVHTRSTWTVHP